MAVGVFPAAKLGVLALKQISKPIANVLKTRAKNSLFFRKYICMPPAQLYNYVEVKTKMLALNLGRPTAVPQLNEAMAIELGANLLGEIIIFVFGAGLLILEYQRQSRKEALKEEMIIQEKMELQATLNELAFQVERQDTQIREMTRILAEIDSKSWTPKIINDVLGRKRIQPECKEEDNPLQLLPEKRGTKKRTENEISNATTDSGNDKSSILESAINFLITDLNLLNYSQDYRNVEKVRTNAFENAVNDLFIDDYEN